MPSSVFVDTSYLLALELARDQNHDPALRHWRDTAALPNPITLITTSFILAETATFLNSRREHARAVRLGNRLFQDPFVQFVHVDALLLREAWTYFEKYDDKDYSLPDCVSFTVMRNLNVTTALTFDHHFQQAGFLIEPI